MISDEIKAAQEAYAARPFAVRWVDSHASGTFRFQTLDEAFAYAQEQWARIQKRCRQARGETSWVASCLWESFLIAPDGRVALAYVLLCNDVTNRT